MRTVHPKEIVIVGRVRPLEIGLVLPIINVYVSRDGKVLIVIKRYVHQIVKGNAVVPIVVVGRVPQYHVLVPPAKYATKVQNGDVCLAP